MAKEARIGSIFLEFLTQSNSMSYRFIAPEIDEIVKNDECAEMFDILVINALGHKCPICESTIDSAMSFIINKCHKEIEASSYDDTEKSNECQQCTDFYTQAAHDIKQHFDKSGLLYKC